MTRAHKDSPKIETTWDVCRECHHIQNCVILRGWKVCHLCLEEIDREYCEKRAAALHLKFVDERAQRAKP